LIHQVLSNKERGEFIST